MYGNYKSNFRAVKKLSEKSWNVSTRPENNLTTQDHYESFRQTPNLKLSKNRYARMNSPDPLKKAQDESFASKNRNKSHISLESSFKKANKLTIRSSRLKDLAQKQDLERKYKVPNFVSSTLIEIYSTTSKDPIAFGLLFAPKLLITSHLGIPNERLAMRCVFRFMFDKSYYKPRVDKFFYSSPQFNLTVLYISRVRKDTANKLPIRIEKNYELKLGDIMFCAESTCFRVQITNIEPDSFGITSHFTPLTGCPVFTST